MRARIAALLLAAACGLAAADKKPAVAKAENEDVEVTASVLADRQAIKEALGSDLDGYYQVIDVRVASRFGKQVEVYHDDFVLRTDKDGEKSTPFAPSQIAGAGALVISQSGGGGGMMADSGGPVWGGVPGTMGRPRRMGGDGGVIGSGGEPGSAQATMDSSKHKPNPLEKTLQAKILSEGKTTKAVSGLLYFPLGKQKLKHLELIYTHPAGDLSLRFR
jgi:hypothetical protein